MFDDRKFEISSRGQRPGPGGDLSTFFFRFFWEHTFSDVEISFLKSRFLIFGHQIRESVKGISVDFVENFCWLVLSTSLLMFDPSTGWFATKNDNKFSNLSNVAKPTFADQTTIFCTGGWQVTQPQMGSLVFMKFQMGVGLLEIFSENAILDHLRFLQFSDVSCSVRFRWEFGGGISLAFFRCTGQRNQPADGRTTNSSRRNTQCNQATDGIWRCRRLFSPFFFSMSFSFFRIHKNTCATGFLLQNVHIFGILEDFGSLDIFL